MFQTEILVAGAGPAGATLARLLALRGRQVTLVDPGDRVVTRLEVLAPAAGPVIQALDLKPLLEMPQIARCCLGVRRRWGTNHCELDDFFSHPGGQGFVVDRSAFDRELLASAKTAGAQFIRGRVGVIKRNETTTSVTIVHGEQHMTGRARIIVDATGRAAGPARRMGARRVILERLIAEKLASTHDESGRPDPVWLEFYGECNGWSYTITGPTGRREAWRVSQVHSRTQHGCSQTVDASSARLSTAAGTGWIAIGDAAASFDPITSQGLVNALSTSLVAAGAILSSRELESEVGAAYSEAVKATFGYSEADRAHVYRSLLRSA